MENRKIMNTKSTNNPRAYTKEEMEDMIYAHMANIAHYWAKESRAQVPIEKCMGVVHSILAMFGGRTEQLPALDIIPSPHEEDKEYYKSKDENWFPDDIKLELDSSNFYPSIRKQGIKEN